MIVPDLPGIFVICNYTENKYFFSFSKQSMYATCSKHFYKIRRGNHTNKELNKLHKALILGHQIEYHQVISSKYINEELWDSKYTNIVNKLYQLIHALSTFNSMYGYNNSDLQTREVSYTDYGIYIIIVRNKITDHRKFYIGKAELPNGIKVRLQYHKYELEADRHTNKELQNDFNKKENETIFKPLITFFPNEITSVELATLEVHMMAILRAIYPGRGYNKNAKGIILHL
ncbi:hypothetical protein AWH56_018580 [Anaerobacillus isosaccharinicus]|uniref:GIY-YIG domain-containing protein n=1 Tax=Anaerobacillus isosaccharinicus TaxID=1532552 RepID=A0A1S2M719_9BACI|nr:hypothetical protein [Anaerobacillus isosaccharinicus]MBA5587089.1 hypothetical protein [Anaerobacillus isosaccharinicus]QOY34715.1 hypothetical protein AWH56_018580 [Anaerobacillus isosaccharinicus]